MGEKRPPFVAMTMQGTRPAEKGAIPLLVQQPERMIPWPAAVFPNIAIWAVAAAATACVIVRPGKWPEAVWAVDSEIILIVGDFTFGQPITDPERSRPSESSLVAIAVPRTSKCLLGRLFYDMPEAGIEPAQSCPRRILSPVRLPVPPLRRRRSG